MHVGVWRGRGHCEALSPERDWAKTSFMETVHSAYPEKVQGINCYVNWEDTQVP